MKSCKYELYLQLFWYSIYSEERQINMKTALEWKKYYSTEDFKNN